MSKTETTALLNFYNMLLEAERAGVTVLNELNMQVEDQQLKPILKKFLRDEGVNCRILVSLIHDLNAKPSDKTGAFVDKIRALDNLDEKIQLLIRGQAWVARKVKEFRFNLPAGSAYWFLKAIKIQHEENVDTLRKYFDK
jgi:formate dehydrogenase maturation protein FdhE